jgi:uncharacterized protein YecE (DUF72 family)
MVYPRGLATRDWLARYAELFDTVEVNSTFYRLANREAVQRWVQQTPERFVFAVKASRYLTHVRRLADVEEGIDRFYERIQPLIDGGRLGPVLWQLPENFRRDDGRLRKALEQLPPGRHAFEFRHPSWFAPEVYAILRRHRAALVYGDHPQRPFQTYERTASWAYARMHYGGRGRRGNYSERELEHWATRLTEWRREQELYVYFNNDWEAFAPRNARRLSARMDHLSTEPPRT